MIAAPSDDAWATPAVPLLVGGLCLLALVGAALVATVLFDRVPHWEDEVAYVFQARSIAAGRLVTAAPPHPEFFATQFVLVHEGRWFGKYSPGYPAVLALGVLIGQPWLVNPLCGAIAVGLVYLAGRRLYGTPTGLLAAALLVASPFFLIQAGSFLSHVASLCWALAFLLLFAVAHERRAPGAALAAGLALGLLFLSRPLTAVGIGLPYALWSGLALLHSWRRGREYLLMLAGFFPCAVGLLVYNRLTTGGFLSSAYELWWPYDKIGFGEGIGPGGYYTLDDARFNWLRNWIALTAYLYGWPGGLSLLPAALAVSAAVIGPVVRGARRITGAARRVRCPRSLVAHRAAWSEAWDLLHAGTIVSLAVVHMAYWYGGQMYGPRYYFEALGAWTLLTARGLLQPAGLMARLLHQFIPAWRRPHRWTIALMLLIVAGLTLHSYSTFVPREFGQFVRWYTIDGSGVRQVRESGVTNAVVFVTQETWVDYAPFFAQHAPVLDADVVYAIDLGDTQNRTLVARYPGRAFYRYAAGQLTPLAPP